METRTMYYPYCAIGLNLRTPICIEVSRSLDDTPIVMVNQRNCRPPCMLSRNTNEIYIITLVDHFSKYWLPFDHGRTIPPFICKLMLTFLDSMKGPVRNTVHDNRIAENDHGKRMKIWKLAFLCIVILTLNT